MWGGIEYINWLGTFIYTTVTSLQQVTGVLSLYPTGHGLQVVNGLKGDQQVNMFYIATSHVHKHFEGRQNYGLYSWQKGT